VNTVTVMIRAKLNGKYPYLPAVWSGNGRLKPNVAFVNGSEQQVEGQYYLRFTEGRNRRSSQRRATCARSHRFRSSRRSGFQYRRPAEARIVGGIGSEGTVATASSRAK
jgi:hypothetical protein